ncbi:MAG: hypothetical protein AAF490_06255 [Chloroflexota bacterium]
MKSLRRAALRKLVATAYEMDFDTMSGVLSVDENGRWKIGKQDLTSWLNDHIGEDMSLVLGADSDERAVVVRTCRTCGRDYTDMECPRCRANRIRLRGHA